jgi:WD40 repeat protein
MVRMPVLGNRWSVGVIATMIALWSSASGAKVRADVVRESSDPILRLDLPGHTGEVRALAFTPDSARLISGGRDKLAIVWTLDTDDLDVDGDDGRATRNIARRRLKERALRWQVARGTRGAIQAVAVSPGEGKSVVAIAGSGAMGSTGEILIVDAKDGTYVQTLGGGDRVGHRQSVAALEFTSDGKWLVSQDLDGQVFAWSRADDWKPKELVAREEARLGAAAAATLRRMPPLRPLAVLGADRVAIPALVSPADAATPVWRIRVAAIGAGQAAPRELPGDHFGVVTALSATPDGIHLASADFSGQVFVSRTDIQAAAARLEVAPAAESLALLPDGKRLAVGVAGAAGQPSRLEIWNTSPAQRISSRPTAAAVRALRVSRDGRWLAWSGGDRHSVTVEPAAGGGENERPLRLGGVGQSITRVAFSTAAADTRRDTEPPAAAEPGTGTRNIVRRKQPAPVAAAEPTAWPRRVAISTAPLTTDDQATLAAAFNLASLAREPVGAVADWAAASGASGGWSLKLAAGDGVPRGVERWNLVRAGKAAGHIDLALDWQGRAGAGGRAVAWLGRTGADGPWAVALGTDRGIFVFRLTDEPGQPCPLVRRFRGHEDTVLSLAVSEDGRWLASGGGDGLVMLWSLSDLGRDRPLSDRWGIGLKVEAGRAVVDAIDEAGPLAGKDVRVGDVITKVSWADGVGAEQRTEHSAAPALAAALAAVPWSTQVVFSTERAGKPRDDFQRYPAWENLASLHLAANREWAFWTPRGYYAASANGDTIFGWLVNRGLDALPRYFRAQQFRRKLERPDVMARLLAAGSLDAALRAAAHDVPESSAVVLPQQIAQAPDVRILAPLPGETAAGRTVTVRAEVVAPDGVEIDRVKAYASGAVAAAAPRLVEEDPAQPGRPRRRVYAWELDLPEEDRHLLQVFAGTREGPTDTHDVEVTSPAALPLRSREPRLYLLASGIDRYAHSARFADLGLTDLAFAVTDARAVRESLARRSLELYDLAADRLLADTEVTRAGWKSAVAEMSARLAGEVEPDDLLVVFLAGHGMTNVEAGRSYSYLCHDAELTVSPAADEPVPAAGGSLGWEDFRVLSDIPCRKLALVDTCHSGALGPSARSVTVREFQENMIVVLAAAADDEPSQEADHWGHGAFTKVLLEALDGRADVGRSRFRGAAGAVAPVAAPRPVAAARNRPDGIVSLDEVIDYVVANVPELTRRGGDDSTAQHPTISPEDLVPYVNLPMTLVGAEKR